MLRLLTDENTHGDIVRGVRRLHPDLDIVRVQEVGLGGADDVVLLEWAAAEDRICVSKDHNTLIGLAYKRVAASLPMAGVLMLKETTPIGQAIDILLVAALCSTAEEWKHRVQHFP
jgi:predicted nuclease of predicted toxin-antitoxin system